MRRSYGDFDPRFLGISLSASDAARWDYLWRFAFGEEVPEGLGTETDDGAFTEATGVLTVLAHEARHFHDFLISSFGSKTMRTRLLLGINLTQVLIYLRSTDTWDDADTLPVPLTTWHRMSKAQRDAITDIVNADAASYGGRPYCLVELPAAEQRPPLGQLSPGARPRSAEAFGALLTLCSAYQERVQVLRSVPAGLKEGGLEPVHLWEASALLVQLQELYNATDAEVTGRLSSILQAERNRYAAALRWLSSLLPNGVPVEVWAVLVGWCLFGEHNPLSGDELGSGELAGSPVERFGMLARAAFESRRGLRGLTGDPEADFRLLDKLAKVPSTRDALERSVHEDEEFIRIIRLRAAEDADAAEILESQMVFYECFARARRHMVTAFLSDPARYLHPRLYLDAADQWTAAPLKVQCGSAKAMRLPADPESGWYTHLNIAGDPTAATVFSPPVPMRGIDHIPREAAFALYELFTAADQLIGPWPTDRSAGEDVFARLLLGREMRFVNVQSYVDFV